MVIQYKSIFNTSVNIHSRSIFVQLIRLSLPVIATSFMSMAYNFINIAFVGKLGSGAVAAVGSAGFYMNLSWGIASLLTVGAGIKVSHAVGENNTYLAKKLCAKRYCWHCRFSLGGLPFFGIRQRFSYKPDPFKQSAYRAGSEKLFTDSRRQYPFYVSEPFLLKRFYRLRRQ